MFVCKRPSTLSPSTLGPSTLEPSTIGPRTLGPSTLRHSTCISWLHFINMYFTCNGGTNESQLKLLSLFAEWLFWTFHTKSHNMKALVILSHSWSPFLPLTYLYGKKWTFVSLCVAIWSMFVRKKLPPDYPLLPVDSFSHVLITVTQTKMWIWRC